MKVGLLESTLGPLTDERRASVTVVDQNMSYLYH